MEKISIHFAKTYLSKILAKVKQGEEVIISNRGEAVAKLVPYCDRKKRANLLGQDKGTVKMSKDFSLPLSKEHLEDFYK